MGINNANCDGCGSQWDNKKTANVGSFKPNSFGLYDMQGNVWEWAQDCEHKHYKEAPADGSAWEDASCERRIARGGSWAGTQNYLRPTDRYHYAPKTRFSSFGFRVVCTK